MISVALFTIAAILFFKFWPAVAIRVARYSLIAAVTITVIAAMIAGVALVKKHARTEELSFDTLPEGFELDKQTSRQLPEGFTLDAKPAAAPANNGLSGLSDAELVALYVKSGGDVTRLSDRGKALLKQGFE